MRNMMLPLKSLPVLLLFLLSCSGSRPAEIGITAGKLAPCPTSPNCVCSDCASSGHRIPPVVLIAPAEQAWQATREQVAALPRTRIVAATEDYLHAECRSAVFGFVDDIELHLRPEEGIIAMRSAARLGYYDFGVNRRRLEKLRTTLREKGIVR